MKSATETVHETFFQRVEDKFIVSRDRKRELFENLSQHLDFSDFNPAGSESLIESIYFDTEDLHFFQAHMSLAPERLKVRLRIYGGGAQDVAYLEVKRKSKGVTHKSRVRISPRQAAALLKGAGLSFTPGRIRDLNPQMKKERLEETVETLRQLFFKFDLIPTLRVAYKRVAFEGGSLRVTLDEGIEVEPMTHLKLDEESVRGCLAMEGASILRRFQSQEQLVVEVKHAGALPSWLTGLMQSLDIKQSSFSKYCWGLAGQKELVCVG